MNRFINALLLFFLLPTMAFTIIVGFDLPLESLRTSGQQIPFRDIIFLSTGIILLTINLRRSVRRWMGLRLVNQIEKFKWNESMSKERLKRVVVYTVLEAVVMAFVGTTLFYVTEEAWMPAIAFWFGALDNIVFLIIGSSKNRFRAGITSKAIIVADRDVNLVYFSGLRKVSIHQQTIYFDYIKNLQLSFPIECIETEQLSSFFLALENQIDRDKVFVTKQR